MVLSQEARDTERARIAQLVLDLVDARGAQIPYQTVMQESGVTRSRFEQLFDDEDDLFDSVAKLWLQPLITAMEDVLATELPPARKMYEFFRRRFVINREMFKADPEKFTIICEMGTANFEKIRSYIDLADHYLCEIIVEAQADGFFAGLGIDETLSLVNQMVSNYTMQDAIVYLGDKLTEEKLARIIDTIFIGLSSEAGEEAAGVNTLRVAS